MSVFAVAELNTRGIHIGERHARENKEKKNSGKKMPLFFKSNGFFSWLFSANNARSPVIYICVCVCVCCIIIIYTYCECVGGVGVWITMTVFRVGYNIYIYIYIYHIIIRRRNVSRRIRKGGKLAVSEPRACTNCELLIVPGERSSGAGYGVRARADYGSCRLVCFPRHRRRTC